MSIRKRYMTIENQDGELVISPGEILSKELHRQKITQKELAAMLGRSEKFISQLITGKVRLTYDVAFDLERALKVPTSRWNAAEAAFQDALTRKQRMGKLECDRVEKWVRTFPYEAMVEAGLVPAAASMTERANHLLDYFCVADVEAYEACDASETGFAAFKKREREVAALRREESATLR